MLRKQDKKAQAGWIILAIIVIVLAVFAFFFFSNSEMRKSICGTHTETYTLGTKNCDSIEGCRCLHESWLGLGACDSCECTKEVSNC